MSFVNLKCADNFWKIYGCHLSELLEHETLTDLRFLTMDSSGENVQSINAHQFLFTAKSPLLQDLCLEAKRKQNFSDPVVLTLPGVDPKSIQALLNYFYFGYTDMNTRDDLEDILCLLGIMDINLDDAETDIKWDDHLSADPLEEEENSGAEEEESFQSCPPWSSDPISPKSNACQRSIKRRVVGPSTSKRNRQPLSEVEYLHSGTYLRRCGLCCSIYLSPHFYNAHLKTCRKMCPSSKHPRRTSERRRRRTSSPVESGSDLFTYKCNYCDKTCNTVSSMKTHTLLQHFKNLFEASLPPVPSLECPDCFANCKNRGILLRHYAFYHHHIYEHLSESDLRGIQIIRYKLSS